jgi:Protein of unknown function (DUF3147)
MIVQAKLESLKGISFREWAIRFFFGGLVCVTAGIIAKRFGPGVGGLFLAFPAIFPAGASMVAAHEKKHKARAGFDGTQRGRTIAGVDAAGAALGCIGLAGFAMICWITLPHLSTSATFGLATLVWFVFSVTAWFLRKGRTFRRLRRRKTQLHAFHNS